MSDRYRDADDDERASADLKQIILRVLGSAAFALVMHRLFRALAQRLPGDSPTVPATTKPPRRNPQRPPVTPATIGSQPAAPAVDPARQSLDQQVESAKPAISRRAAEWLRKHWFDLLAMLAGLSLSVLIGVAVYRAVWTERSLQAATIVVTTRDLAAATAIAAADITTTTTSSPPATGALTDTTTVIGRVVRVPLLANTPLTTTDLLTPPDQLQGWWQLSVANSPALDLTVGQPVIVLGVKAGASTSEILSQQAIVVATNWQRVVLALPPDHMRRVAPYLLPDRRLLIVNPRAHINPTIQPIK
jgi:hypothetical protein